MRRENDGRIIKVLWTGGWDSTFRMLELALDNQNSRTIMPIYVTGDKRPSEPKEIETMYELLQQLREISNNEILDLTIINKDEIPQDRDITNTFEYIRGIVKIGSQYEWLARLAMMHPGIEIGIEKPNGEYSGCVAAIEKTGKMICSDGICVVDQESSSRECRLLFQNFNFPLITRTEEEMVASVRQWGYEELMKKIWFCHTPKNNEPCGYCRPCQQKMECNMSWLLPVSSQKRYKTYKKITKLFGHSLGKRIFRVFTSAIR